MFVSVFNFEFGVDLWSRVSPPALLSVHGGYLLYAPLERHRTAGLLVDVE